MLMLSGNWQEWFQFGTNRLSVGLGPGTVKLLERNVDDTWCLGGAGHWQMGGAAILSVDIKYVSSPVSDAMTALYSTMPSFSRTVSALEQTSDTV